MKSAIAKGALALSILGFTFGSSVVYDQQWSPSIFRTIANAVQNETLTEDNLEAELNKLEAMVVDSEESSKSFTAKMDNEETGLSELINMRNEELGALKDSVMSAFTRAGDFSTFFAENLSEEEMAIALRERFEAISERIGAINSEPNLDELISVAQEKEILEQKAAIVATNERLCENKGLLEDIKSQIAKLLKDKEEVVAEVEEKEKDELFFNGFGTNVTTYADFFAHIQRQQSSFFEVAPPSLLAPAPVSNPMNMFMMMSLMNGQQQAQRPLQSTPRSQVNTYYLGGGLGSYSGFPSGGFNGGFNSAFRDPATSYMPRLMPTIGGTNYTQVIPRFPRGDASSAGFSF